MNKKGINKKKTNEEFLNEAYLINDKIKILSEYKGAQQKIKYKCLICNKIWETKATHLLSGHGCRFCNRNTKTNEKFILELQEIAPDIKVLSEYKNNESKIRCQCIKCENIWQTSAKHLLEGRGCPKCCSPRGELIIGNLLDNKNIKYCTQYKFDDLLGIGGRNLTYDFYLPKYNLLIEYQGEQHFKPTNYLGGEEKFKKQIEHDNRKREYAKKNNINLLEITYKDNIKNKLNSYFETVTTAGY